MGMIVEVCTEVQDVVKISPGERGPRAFARSPLKPSSRVSQSAALFYAWLQKPTRPEDVMRNALRGERLQSSSTRVYLSLTQILLNIHRSTIRREVRRPPIRNDRKTNDPGAGAASQQHQREPTRGEPDHRRSWKW